MLAEMSVVCDTMSRRFCTMFPMAAINCPVSVPFTPVTWTVRSLSVILFAVSTAALSGLMMLLTIQSTTKAATPSEISTRAMMATWARLTLAAVLSPSSFA